MYDERMREFAKVLVNYSTAVKPKDKVLIRHFDVPYPLINALVREVYAAGGYPFVMGIDSRVNRELMMGADEEWAKRLVESQRAVFDVDAYIGIHGDRNQYELSDVPKETLRTFNRIYRGEILDPLILRARWVVVSYPNAEAAQGAGMSSEAFADFFYNVCTVDYAKMDRDMDALVARLNDTKHVRIVSPGTDIRFDITGIPRVKCAGRHNVPDGEVYTAPVIDSAEGYITYNAPSNYDGFRFENVRLEFEKGRIVRADGNDSGRINSVLDTDPGARFIGEFALGVNPKIKNPTGDILFDEKIAGSIHLTPGRAYEDADNGNRSAVHWDLVLIQTREYGGGEIYFDDVLVRKDGIFVEPSLAGLN